VRASGVCMFGEGGQGERGDGKIVRACVRACAFVSVCGGRGRVLSWLVCVWVGVKIHKRVSNNTYL